MKFLDKLTIKMQSIPTFEAFAVIVMAFSAASNGIDVRSIIAKEAAGFLPALA